MRRPREIIANLTTVVESLRGVREGMRFAYGLAEPDLAPAAAPDDRPNPLEAYFDSVTEGPGVWKWRHYFSIYHRHLAKFIGQEVHVVEIGVYSGGSLRMWRSYLGERCHVYGVDIEPGSRAYEDEGIRIFIGDQADPDFWERFVREVPRIDVVVDDGGHLAHQQITTLKGLLPEMAHGGVYVCEDIHGPLHQFHSFIDGLTRPLSGVWRAGSVARPIHEHVASVHRYPAVSVIEKPDRPVQAFSSVKHGTEWAPTYD